MPDRERKDRTVATPSSPARALRRLPVLVGVVVVLWALRLPMVATAAQVAAVELRNYPETTTRMALRARRLPGKATAAAYFRPTAEGQAVVVVVPEPQVVMQQRAVTGLPLVLAETDWQAASPERVLPVLAAAAAADRKGEPLERAEVAQVRRIRRMRARQARQIRAAAAAAEQAIKDQRQAALVAPALSSCGWQPPTTAELQPDRQA